MSRQLLPSITLLKGTVTEMLAYAKNQEQIVFSFVTDLDSGEALQGRVDRALEQLEISEGDYAAICRAQGLRISTIFFTLKPDGILRKTLDESYDALVHLLNCDAERYAPRKMIVVTDSLKIGNEMIGQVPYISSLT